MEFHSRLLNTSKVMKSSWGDLINIFQKLVTIISRYLLRFIILYSRRLNMLWTDQVKTWKSKKREKDDNEKYSWRLEIYDDDGYNTSALTTKRLMYPKLFWSFIQIKFSLFAVWNCGWYFRTHIVNLLFFFSNHL